MLRFIRRIFGSRVVHTHPAFYCPVWGECPHRNDPQCNEDCGIRRAYLEGRRVDR